MPNKKCPICLNATNNCTPNLITKCDICTVIMHRVCIDLPAEDDITRPKNKNVKHLCNDCCRTDDKFEHLKNFLVQFVDQKLSSLEMTLSKREIPIPAAVEEKIIAEATERLVRKNNIIIRNLPESTNASSDTSQVTAILSVIQGSDVAAPVEVARIGKTTTGKPRLLKVKLGNPSQVNAILRNKNKLSLTDRYKKISILADQTPQQMKYLEEVRQELKQRQDSGENVTIKYKRGIPTIVPNDDSKN